ncbi:hypothetical protein EYF80_049973 [Liparis tanakae]|uniref:Uncharacterized protein n=1 Tax=Liparis tanakae TaxID=230148 RepID=A0A4Z2FFA5_9TELE|nr:hypothetical protein EYF80_049973 [Liparis tanakae]
MLELTVDVFISHGTRRKSKRDSMRIYLPAVEEISTATTHRGQMWTSKRLGGRKETITRGVSRSLETQLPARPRQGEEEDLDPALVGGEKPEISRKRLGTTQEKLPLPPPPSRPKEFPIMVPVCRGFPQRPPQTPSMNTQKAPTPIRGGWKPGPAGGVTYLRVDRGRIKKEVGAGKFQHSYCSHFIWTETRTTREGAHASYPKQTMCS